MIRVKGDAMNGGAKGNRCEVINGVNRCNSPFNGASAVNV